MAGRALTGYALRPSTRTLSPARVAASTRSTRQAARICCCMCCAMSGHLQLQQQPRSEEHTSELQSRLHLVCRLLLEKKTTCACERNALDVGGAGTRKQSERRG